MTNVRRIFAILHKALYDAENNHATHHLFGDLTGEECVIAHNILKDFDDALKARWKAEGEPDGERLR